MRDMPTSLLATTLLAIVLFRISELEAPKHSSFVSLLPFHPPPPLHALGIAGDNRPVAAASSREPS